MYSRVVILTFFLLNLYLCELPMSEWQTGFDQTINEQRVFSTHREFPVNMFKEIKFPQAFSKPPQVLLTIEDIKWEKGESVDFYVTPTLITETGFKLAYHVGGPSQVKRMTVRWVGIVDDSVEIKYLDISKKQLKRVRNGKGTRSDSYVIKYDMEHAKTPEAGVFLLGAQLGVTGKISHYSVDVSLLDKEQNSVRVKVASKHGCKVKAVKLALISSSSQETILLNGGSLSTEANRFYDNSLEWERVEKIAYQLPESFGSDNHNNILSQGITGFDASSQKGDFYAQVGQQYIQDNYYHLSYGTKDQAVLYGISYQALLHPQTQQVE